MPDMQRAPDALVSLSALSERQRRAVERHLPLVWETIRRHPILSRGRGVAREPAELFQEGCLALVEAVRSHDPSRHGRFPPYAMSRIHHAISRYAQEHDAAVRVPFIVQRRMRGRRRARPRVDRLSQGNTAHDTRGARRHIGSVPGESSERSGPTIGEIVRERLHAAVRRAARALSTPDRRGAVAPDLVDACLKERWLVPEPDMKTSLRRLARSLDCDVSRVTRAEARFRRLVAKHLNEDATYLALARLAKSRPEGMAHRPGEGEFEFDRRVDRDSRDEAPGARAVLNRSRHDPRVG